MTTTTDRRLRRRRSRDDVATATGWRAGVEVFCERAAFYLLCLLLLFAPLAFGAVRPWSRDPMHLVMMLALLCWAARVAVAGRIAWVRTPLDVPMAVGLVYVVARYATSPVEWESRQEMLVVLMYGAAYFVATQHLVRRLRLSILLWLLVAVAFVICVYAIINRIRGVEMVWWLKSEYAGRASGTFYCPNHFSGYLELVLAVVGAQLLWSGRSAAQRIMLAYGAAVMLAGIVLSLSRGGCLSTAAMLMLLAFAVSRGVSKQWWPGAVLVATLAASGIMAVSSFPSIRTRFESLVPTDSGALRPNEPLKVGEASRWWMWVGAAKMFADHPWFGVGPFLFNTCYGLYRVPEDQAEPEHVHNDYLQVLTDYGIVGFVLMGVLVVTFFIAAWRIHQRWRQLGRADGPRWHWPFWLDMDRAGRPAWLLGSVLAVFCYMVHSVPDFNLHISANALTLAVIMAAGMAADCSRRLVSEGEGEGVTRPPVVKLIELSPLGRRVAVCAVVAGVIGAATIVVPNYVGYLFQRLAEKQYAVEKAAPDATNVVVLPDQLTQQHAEKLAASLAYAGRSWRWDPRNFRVARLLGNVILAQARMSYNQGDVLAARALRWYEEAERLNPFLAELPTRRADALEFLGRWQDAGAARRRAVALEPNCYLYNRQLGMFYMRRGKKDLAIESFQRAAALWGNDHLSRGKLRQLGAPPLPSRPPAQAASQVPEPERDKSTLKRQLEKLDAAPRPAAPAQRSNPAVVLRELLAPLPKKSAPPPGGAPAAAGQAPKRDSGQLMRQLEKLDAAPRPAAPAQRSDPGTVLRELLAPLPARPAPAQPPPANKGAAPPAPAPAPASTAPQAGGTQANALLNLVAPLPSASGNMKPRALTPLQKPLLGPLPPPAPAADETPKQDRSDLVRKLDEIAATPHTNAPPSSIDTNKINRILAPFIRRR